MRALLVLLVACGSKSDKAPEARQPALDKLIVAIDQKPMRIDRAFVKRASKDVYTVMLGEGKGSCELLLSGGDEPKGRAIGFTVTTRLAPSGHDNHVVTDLWSREFPASVPLPATIDFAGNADKGTTVAIDFKQKLGDAVFSVEGQLTAVGCGEVAPTGLGVPKIGHKSKGTILVAGRKVPVRGATVAARKGVAPTDMPNIVISAGPLDCSGVTIPSPVVLERTDLKWTLRGTYFQVPLTGDEPTGLTFSANDVGKSIDGATLTLQLSGKGKFGDYSVELFDTVEAIECAK